MKEKAPSAPRCAALVGSYLSGKTTLLESILHATGAVNRKGSVAEGNTVGDASAEARARTMSVEVTAATTEYLGEEWTFLDCPGSVELVQDTYNALMVADVAVIVCEPTPAKALTVAPLLKFLGDRGIPHMIFVNRMDQPPVSLEETVEALRTHTDRPLIMRQIPIRDDERITGHVDLTSERAFEWKEGEEAKLIDTPEAVRESEQLARTDMLEVASNFDDTLLEQLLEEKAPATEEVYAVLTRAFQEGKIVPVLFGSALQDFGVQRLLKALRHEVPEPSHTAERRGADLSAGEPLAQVFKTVHGGQTGKLSLARVWCGEINEGMNLNGSRVSGLFRMLGHKQDKMARFGAGSVTAIGRMDEVATGTLLSASGTAVAKDWPEPMKPLYSLAVHAENRSDEVKLSGALGKLSEEDPTFSFEANKDTSQLVVWGQGEMHLQISLDRLRNRHNLGVLSSRPKVPYKESIRKSVSQHARHKKQTGGHGQFGDVHVDIKPLPRGSGFSFNNSISGGVVPKQYIPSVENGVKDYLGRGPLGFQVVDLSVTLTDGQFHSVDSSDMAFRMAGSLAMREGMPKCDPVLLEPFCQVEITLPSEFTSKMQRLISGRRGQILGFEGKPDWNGWDEVSVQLPQSEMYDLINELRSITLGVGTFQWRFDHLQELSGRLSEQVVAARAEEE